MLASTKLAEELKELSGWEFDHVQSYSLGFLLRKLLEYGLPQPGVQYVKAMMTWRAYIDEWNRDADTPENAVAKLCVELFKQGVLTK